MGVIVTERLTRRYGARRGVEAVNLDVPQGARFGFLGPNGSGKTTAIRVLLGFLKPTTGQAAIFGHDCWRAGSLIKRDVGYLPGDLRLYPGMSGNDLVRIVALARRRDLRGEARSLADRFGLDLSVTVRKMSRGMRQKLGLILALAPRPKLLLLDEPTASLDPLMQDALLEHLRDLAAAGHTVVFSSHTLSEVERLCDEVAIFREGRVVADERLETLRAQAERDVTIRFSGSPPEQVPPFLALHDRDGRTWRGHLEGSAQDLVRWANDKPIDDLVIAPPNLESLFRRHYRAGTEQGEEAP
ncbi:MAG: ABC transporter ATP-binding protein [Planctomycetota bacterium]|jgi:ABC-2 type transport system ATP-binding protein